MDHDPAAPESPEQAVSLPADRSFVLQLRPGSGVDRSGPWAGRVEHVVSGDAAHFADCAGLREFIARTLRTRASGPRERHQEPE